LSQQFAPFPNSAVNARRLPPKSLPEFAASAISGRLAEQQKIRQNPQATQAGQFRQITHRSIRHENTSKRAQWPLHQPPGSAAEADCGCRQLPAMGRGNGSTATFSLAH
jgi:hypothetical protein